MKKIISSILLISIICSFISFNTVMAEEGLTEKQKTLLEVTGVMNPEYALDAKLMKYFYERNKPIFGICGGHQAINVFLGGTLKKVDDPVAHENGDEKRHIIDIKEGSFVHDVFGKTEAMVNCYHAWEIDDLAPDLDAVARTRDGVIEAIEWKEKNIYATQWHPEQSFHTGDPIENKFFENFLKRCEESR